MIVICYRLGAAIRIVHVCALVQLLSVAVQRAQRSELAMELALLLSMSTHVQGQHD